MKQDYRRPLAYRRNPRYMALTEWVYITAGGAGIGLVLFLAYVVGTAIGGRS